MCDKVSAEMLNEFKEAFTLFDQDGDGVINKKDLDAMMRSLGQTLDETELDDMITSVDTKGNGCIDLQGFVTMLSRRIKDSPEKEMKEAFSVYDINNNGFIKKSEIKRAVRSLGQGITEDEVDSMISQLDSKGDNINYEDFWNLLVTR